jgi:hypothetical protein
MKKRELINGILDAKNKLFKVKQQLYEIRDSSSSQSTSKLTKLSVDNNKPCYQKVVECKIDNGMDLLNTTFCGTDSGIVTLTEAVAFNLERLKFYLEL